MPWPLYPRYPMDRRMGGPQSWCGHDGERKFPAPARNLTLVIKPADAKKIFYTKFIGIFHTSVNA